LKTRILWIFLLVLILFGQQAFSQQKLQNKVDTIKNSYSLKEKKYLGLWRSSNPFDPLPANFNRDVTYDAVNKIYIIREKIGNRLLLAPQYLTVEEYQRLLNSELKRENWRLFANAEAAAVRQNGIIPSLKVNSHSFERLFGGNTIDIKPRGEAELTLLGRINKNENPLFNESQKVQSNFDFNQRIQMDLIGNIGSKLKVNMNYNTEAQFDFENQIRNLH